MIAHASEDIGMADSNALLIACCAMYAVEKIGPPECYLNLSHAIIYLCEAEKSNSVYIAMQKAMDDAESEREDIVPNHLKIIQAQTRMGMGNINIRITMAVMLNSNICQINLKTGFITNQVKMEKKKIW